MPSIAIAGPIAAAEPTAWAPVAGLYRTTCEMPLPWVRTPRFHPSLVSGAAVFNACTDSGASFTSPWNVVRAAAVCAMRFPLAAAAKTVPATAAPAVTGSSGGSKSSRPAGAHSPKTATTPGSTSTATHALSCPVSSDVMAASFGSVSGTVPRGQPPLSSSVPGVATLGRIR